MDIPADEVPVSVFPCHFVLPCQLRQLLLPDLGCHGLQGMDFNSIPLPILLLHALREKPDFRFSLPIGLQKYSLVHILHGTGNRLGQGMNFLLGQELPQTVVQCLIYNWLCQKSLKAIAQIFLSHAADSIGSQGNNLGIFLSWQLTQPFQCFHAVHYRHHMIHKYHIIFIMCQQIQGIKATGSRVNGNLIRCQHSLCHLQIHAVVIHQQHPGFRCGKAILEQLVLPTHLTIIHGSHRPPVRHLVYHGPGKGAAHAIGAVHGNFSPHGMAQGTADGQSQSGPLHIAVLPGIHLLKAGKQLLQIILLDADACILHATIKADAVAIPQPFVGKP